MIVLDFQDSSGSRARVDHLSDTIGEPCFICAKSLTPFDVSLLARKGCTPSLCPLHSHLHINHSQTRILFPFFIERRQRVYPRIRAIRPARLEAVNGFKSHYHCYHKHPLHTTLGNISRERATVSTTLILLSSLSHSLYHAPTGLQANHAEFLPAAQTTGALGPSRPPTISASQDPNYRPGYRSE